MINNIIKKDNFPYVLLLLYCVLFLRSVKSQVYDIVPNGENSVMYDVPINFVSIDRMKLLNMDCIIPMLICRTHLGT